jgi:hypothetical protein
MSGSLCGWGDIFIPWFNLVIFLWVPTEVRLAWLRERERNRFGAEALGPGGERHDAHVASMNWAAACDEGREGMRSRQRHEQWLAALACLYLCLEGTCTIEA